MYSYIEVIDQISVHVLCIYIYRLIIHLTMHVKWVIQILHATAIE